MKKYNANPVNTEIMDFAMMAKGYKEKARRAQNAQDVGQSQKKEANYEKMAYDAAVEWVKIEHQGTAYMKRPDSFFEEKARDLLRSLMVTAHDFMSESPDIDRSIHQFERDYITAPTPKSVEDLVKEGIEAQLPGAVAAALKVKEAERLANRTKVGDDFYESNDDPAEE